jgi:RNase P subunit RPR2
MKKLSIANRTITYFSRGENIPSIWVIDGNEHKITFRYGREHNPNMLLASNNNNIRAIIEIPAPDWVWLYYLYWIDKTNPDEVDIKIATGQFISDDFKFAITVNYDITICPHCASAWHSLLLFGQFTKGTLTMEDVKPHLNRSCPDCGKDLRRNALKMIERVDKESQDTIKQNFQRYIEHHNRKQDS